MSKNIIDQLPKLAIDYPNDYNKKMVRRNAICIHEEETIRFFRQTWGCN